MLSIILIVAATLIAGIYANAFFNWRDKRNYIAWDRREQARILERTRIVKPS